MKILQKLRPYFFALILISSAYDLIVGGGCDRYFYLFEGVVFVSALIGLLNCIPDSKNEEKVE